VTIGEKERILIEVLRFAGDVVAAHPSEIVST
jgi:hypothetical protein